MVPAKTRTKNRMETWLEQVIFRSNLMSHVLKACLGGIFFSVQSAAVIAISILLLFFF